MNTSNVINRKLFVICIAALVLSLNCCAKPVLVKKSDSFKQRVDTVKIIFLEKPDVSIRLGETRFEATRLPEEEVEAAEQLIASVCSQLQRRGIEVKKAWESSDTGELKMVVCMDMLKRSGLSNTLETLRKVMVAAGTAGLVIDEKDPSGYISINATLTDECVCNSLKENADCVLWSNRIDDFSAALIGQSHFDIEQLTAKLFDLF